MTITKGHSLKPVLVAINNFSALNSVCGIRLRRLVSLGWFKGDEQRHRASYIYS